MKTRKAAVLPRGKKIEESEIRKIFKQEGMTRDMIFKMGWCLGLALFWVVFLWGFWDKGLYALGFNAFLFWALVLALFARELKQQKRFKKYDLAWLAPLALIALSFVLYNNPFLKIISLPVYPVLCALFINYGFLEDKRGHLWNYNFLFCLARRILSFLGRISEAASGYLELVMPKSGGKKQALKKSVMGIILFVLIAFTVVIPLLSSADPVFADRLGGFYDWFQKFISQDIAGKILVFIVLSLGLFSALLAWRAKFAYEDKKGSGAKVDPIVSGIVIGGILGIYLLFLWIQLKRLFVGELPFNFNTTETLVKGGFWQLLALSVLNIIIYFFTYRRTNGSVQKILAAFTIASLLLLVSAAQRMGLYVFYYGFSYEKFFASYAVLYCAILFAWLIYRLFITKRADIFKFVLMLFLWMFALSAVFPVEQFIFRANLRLSERADSRINLYELTMLSPDVSGLVKKTRDQGRLISKWRNPESGEYEIKESDWGPWIERQAERIKAKKWHEKTISDLF